MDNFKRWFKKTIRPGCEWLRDYERDAIVAFFLSRSGDERSKLAQQFRRLDMQQRSPSGKLLQLFDALEPIRKGWPNSILLEPFAPLIGYQVSIQRDGNLHSRFVVFLGHGGLGEIQFAKRPSDFESRSVKISQLFATLESDPALPRGLRFQFEKTLTEDEDQELEDSLEESP